MEYKVVEGENNRECEEDGSVDPALLPLSPTKLLEVTSPTSKKSPLVFLKKRVAKTSSGKKRRESGQSGDGVEAEHDEPGAISPTTGNVVSPVRSPSFEHQQAGKEKPQRKGIAKVFHDLRFRSRVRKSQSAPSASAMESTPISGAPSQTSMDDDSFSSYATPAEAVSSGYSTPMYGSNLASPEASMSQAESYVEEEEEGDVTAVGESLDQQSPSKAASALLASSRSPASSPNDAFRASPSSRSSSALVETSPVSLERSSAKPAAAAAAETEHVVRTETLANPVVLEKSSGSCASSKEDYRRAETTSSSPSSATIPASPLKSEQTVAQATSTIPRPSPETVLSKSSPSTKPTKEAPSESELRQRKIEKAEAKPLGEIRFYFTEHCPNNNQSPQRGLMRSLPGDGKMEASHPGHDANGYPKNEHLYKVLVIGELGTGKTSIIKRYVHQFFSQHYRATIGVDFALKVVHWDQNTVIRLQLWDIAGQERFGNMTRVYYKEAVGAFIVFDVTRQSTFESVTKWKQDLDAKVQLPDGSPIPCVLLANKCDQPKEGIAANPAKLDEYCREKGFAGWFETSAKDNINIDDAAKFLVGTILQNDQWSTSIKEEDPDRLDLNGKGAPGDEHKKSTCC